MHGHLNVKNNGNVTVTVNIVTGCIEQREIKYTRFAIGATCAAAPKVTDILCRHVMLSAVRAVHADCLIGFYTSFISIKFKTNPDLRYCKV